jgi:hypothetical protein
MMELEDDPEHVTSGDATMHCEEPGTSPTLVKSTEEELDEPDAMVEFLEILNDDVEDENQMNIMLENGKWFPEEMSRAGDQPCNLFDKIVFENVGGEKSDGGHIPMHLIIRWKNYGCAWRT